MARVFFPDDLIRSTFEGDGGMDKIEHIDDVALMGSLADAWAKTGGDLDKDFDYDLLSIQPIGAAQERQCIFRSTRTGKQLNSDPSLWATPAQVEAGVAYQAVVNELSSINK